MAFRFWRRGRIAPGVTINMSKSGASLSVGPRGAKYTIGLRGHRVTAGIPGTGIFYSQTLGTRSKGRRSAPPAPRIQPEDRLRIGFFKRLITPDDEEAFVDGCRLLFEEDEKAALDQLRGAPNLADAMFTAGVVALKLGRYEEAASLLEKAKERSSSLGASMPNTGWFPMSPFRSPSSSRPPLAPMSGVFPRPGRSVPEARKA